MVICAMASAHQHRVLKAIVLEDMQPNCFVDPNTNSLTGFQVDILNLLSERLGYEVKYTTVGNWKEVDSAIQKGKTDVCPVFTPSETRESYTAFTSPLETFGLTISVRADNNEIVNISSLHGKNVGVIRSSQAAFFLADKPEIRCVEFDSFHKAIFSLLAGQIDAFVAPNTVIMYIVYQIHLEERIKLIYPPLKEIKRSFGLPISRTALRDSFNVEIAKFIDSDEYQKLHEKWFGEPPPFMTTKEIIAASVVLLIMVTIFMAAWRYRSLSIKNSELEFNIKKRIEAEATLQKSIEELEKTQRLESLGILAGGIAHDFNNLLGGLFGYIDIARNRAIKESSTAVEPLTKSLAVYNRAKDLTKQLLTFAKGGLPIKVPLDIEKLLKQAEDISLGGSRVDCKIIITENLHPVEGDTGQLHQAFSNIMINARQAMPDGGIITVVCKNYEVTAENSAVLKPGKYIEIAFTDTGTGIPASLIDKVFDPFFTTKQSGSGLGLATTFSIVRKHGGQLNISSKEGEGTTLKVLLPASIS
ncbi:MAG: transporter substrate-binding domain-containing protein [Fibrobacteres bacterium]|nr:transporter substrate-binding domain-containing protein [Fibrobacterota bacterium]